MQTVAKMHQARGTAQVISVIHTAIGAIEIEVCGLHAGGVGICLLTVIVSDEES